MTTNLIPFEQSGLPAHIAAAFAPTSDLMSGMLSFSTVSIKGKTFHVVRGDERELITREGTDEPAASIEVVILDVGPKEGRSAKVYYASGYVEGADAKPACYSNDGLTPAADAQAPQCKTCGACPHNVFGSKITESGAKAKACTDSKRLAIAPAGMLNDPMLLRVPAASLKALSQYNDLLNKRGAPYQAVVTKIGFDYSVAYPALTFKPAGFCTPAMINDIKETIKSDVVRAIVGASASPAAAPVVATVTLTPAKVDAPAPVAAAPAPVAEVPVDAPAPAPKRRKTGFSSEAAATPAPAVAAAPAPAAVVATPAPAPAAQTASAGMATAVASIDDVSFDD